MKKEEIIEKLKELGIETNNAYPKASFISSGAVCVGLYKREMNEDFYFFNKYDGKIYKWKVSDKINVTDYDTVTEKYQIPLSSCSLIWEDKPYVEKPDAQFNTMTLRQYACIHLRVPDSGLNWLDNLIKQTSPL